MKPGLLCWICLSLVLLPERTPAAMSAAHHFAVQSPQPAVTQQLCTWSEDAWKTLQDYWRVQIPFRTGGSIRIFHTADAMSVKLSSRLENGRFLQVIQCPLDLGVFHQELADAVAEALLRRMVVQAGGDVSTPLPAWIREGHGSLLLPMKIPELSLAAVRDWRPGDLDFPERWHEKKAGDPQTRVVGLQLLGWLQQSFEERRDGWSPLFRQLAQGNSTDLAWWIQAIEGVEDMRDLHVSWDLWMSERNREAPRESRLQEAAMHQLKKELILCPAEFGFAGEAFPRYEFLDLKGLKPWLGEEWVGHIVYNWMMRIQVLKNGQSQEFADMVEQFVEAGRRFHAAMDVSAMHHQAKLREFDAQWARALSGMREVEEEAIRRNEARVRGL